MAILTVYVISLVTKKRRKEENEGEYGWASFNHIMDIYCTLCVWENYIIKQLNAYILS